ncbi:MAG: ATP-binding cassette domain-containing protein [Rubrivivax sp.]|nr:ATP-binding cassette domain-containing protein [Rubrivivax sp.]
MTAPAAALRLQAVHLAVAGQVLIERLDAVVEPGQCLVVMGASGSGKSSLLAWLAGTLDGAFTARGCAFIGASELTALAPEHRRLGLLFQDDLLFPHLTAGGNLAFALPATVRGRAERARRVQAALAEAGLAGFEHRDPATLSGGQRARVALLRTLLAEPRALLLDEPFGKLDAHLRDAFRRNVFDHARQRALPMVLVTHDAADADAAVQACGGHVVRLAPPQPEAGQPLATLPLPGGAPPGPAHSHG